MALIDPAVVEEMKLTTGDVIEITMSSGKKKTFALLWSGQPEDYGLRIIRVYGYTRNNLGNGIDDHIKIRTRHKECGASSRFANRRTEHSRNRRIFY